MPPFTYSDNRYECYDCEYEESEVLGDGSIYLGQWKNGQLYGRGTLLNAGGSEISEGYFKDGIFVGQGRKITSERIAMEWDSEGKLKEKQYECHQKLMKCRPKKDQN